MNNMMKKIFYVILTVIAMMATGCGKFHTCKCVSYTTSDIIDTTLADSVQDYPVATNIYTHESVMDCSYWSSRDTVGQYLPEYGIQMYYFVECHEK
jgi:uncharacterized membrane-anchored protein